MTKKLGYKYYYKWIKTCNNGNVQSHDQEESQLNITVNAKRGAHSSFNKNNIATIKTNKILTNILLLSPFE